MLTPLAVLAADRVAGEPPDRWHPVVWFGRAAHEAERRLYRDGVAAGALHSAVLVGGAAGIGIVMNRALGRRTAAVVAGAMSVAGRMLADEVTSVGDALAVDDLALARQRVSRIVGRETGSLDVGGVARAAIESLAENSVDAVTAPLFFAAVGGAPAVLAHRAVNTLDAMVGHRTDRYERFGKSAALIDDAMAWLPARLTAAVVMMVRPRRAREVVLIVRRDARAHPSPNGGVVEAAFAAALGVRLGDVNRYGSEVDDRGTLGDGGHPTVPDVGRAVRLAWQTWWATAVVLTLVRLGVPRRISPTR
ncbi:MAG: adenosylcobinamide-phosphate synthase CbiB [Ilumatobacter fluminis]|uniref:adenosylcobinamide-phosphate synthase CbiB n=1 Tax=Ilumatobacter fluminis TaxID=467091 RepID=UPI0032EE6CBE